MFCQISIYLISVLCKFEEKIPLYTKLHAALKEDGYFILTDYFAPDDAYEAFYRQELLRLKGRYHQLYMLQYEKQRLQEEA